MLGITGGIAAYKTPDLVRRLRDTGAQVQVVMTAGAKAFITPLTLQAVSGQPVRSDLLDEQAEAAMGHIELARWADLILIAPATADFMARLAHGFADDLLTTLCLASAAPIVLAPAMNRLMWSHPATQVNAEILKSRGVALLGPAVGDQACGEVGPGRMVEPLEIVSQLEVLRPTPITPILTGTRILITAGPTREAIDPVRYVTNRSSGKMGFAVASAAVAAGAQVTLVTGPVQLPTPPGVVRINVETAAQMHDAVMAQVETCDLFIGTAAVADYRPEKSLTSKMKKTEATIQLQMIRNTDILAAVASRVHPPFTVGFAAETDNLADYAQKKRRNKKIDMIAANAVNEQGLGFDSDDNALTAFWEGGQQVLPRQPKRQLAQALLTLIAEHYRPTRG